MPRAVGLLALQAAIKTIIRYSLLFFILYTLAKREIHWRREINVDEAYLPEANEILVGFLSLE